MNIHKNTILILSLILLLTAIYGCSGPAPSEPAPPTEQETFLGTIGSVCELTGYQAARVQAYSLVIGLPRTGSNECPVSIKVHLLQELRRLKSQNQLPGIYADIEAERVISSPSTAVVAIRALVPAGAPKGETFDVEISAIEGTQTTSLQGGILIPTDLQVVVPGKTGRMLAGRPIAAASGPIFINPFPTTGNVSQNANSQPNDSQQIDRKADPRRGVILGGGKTKAPRKIELSLLRPDYRTAQLVRNRINSRFVSADDPEVAQATRSSITLTVPEKYRDNYPHFISLVWGMYLRENPGYLETKLRELVKLIEPEDADYESIAMSWEGIGKPALKYLEPLYSQHTAEKKGFYAARTALNLEDKKAIDYLIIMARDARHPCQGQAAQALTTCADDLRARRALTNLLNQDNYQLRLIAYQGLLQSGDSIISSTSTTAGFKIDQVKTTGEKFIAAWAVDEPRIVIFGDELQCQPNLFYESRDDSITLDAQNNATEISITRRLPGQERFISLESPFDLKSLTLTLTEPLRNPENNKVFGPGLSYSQIVGVFYDLCENKSIPAQFKLHRTPEDLIY